MMADFKEAFYGVDKAVSSGGIDADKYKTLYPLFVLDVSKQMEKLKSTVVDISLKMVLCLSFNTNNFYFQFFSIIAIIE